MTDFPFDPPYKPPTTSAAPTDVVASCGCIAEPLSQGEPLIRHRADCPARDDELARISLAVETVDPLEGVPVVRVPTHRTGRDNGDRLARETDEAIEAVVVPTPVTAALVLSSEVRHVLDYRDPDQVAEAARYVRERVVDGIRGRHDELRKAREALVVDGRATVGDLSPELREIADVRDAIAALERALGAGRAEAEGILRELVEETGKRSSRLADGHGAELVVRIEQRRDLSVDVDAIVAVIRGALAFAYDDAHPPIDRSGSVEDRLVGEWRDRYLEGVDAGIGKLRGLLATTPAFRTTALDAFAKELAGHDDGRARLAAGLERAYARVDKGEPSVKLERKIDDEAAQA